MSLQNTVYTFGLKLAHAVLNPGWVQSEETPTPTVYIIQDQQDESAPATGTYVAISGSPRLSSIGQAHTEPQAEDDPEAEGPDDSRGIVQPYVGTLVFWEVNGDGGYLQTIKDSVWLDSVRTLLESTGVAVLDVGDVEDVGYKIDNRWIPQSRMTMEVSVANRITETLSTINTVEITRV